MIEVDGLTKRYGAVTALRNLSFHVARGSVVGFLGPNGAGKTTALRILAGFIGPTQGSARISGFDVQRQSLAARKRLGYMPESAPLYPEMRVREYLAFRAELKGISRQRRKSAVTDVLRQAVIEEVAETPILHLSKGFRQRVALADALVANPPLLILDEPTAGLDPNQIRQVRQLIAELGGERTVLLSTHVLSEVEAICQRAIVIHRGQKVAEGTLDELRDLRQPGGLELTLSDPGGVADGILGSIPEAMTWSTRQSQQELQARIQWLRTTDTAAATEKLFFALAASGIGVRQCRPLVASLDEVFASLTTEDGDAHRPVDEP